MLFLANKAQKQRMNFSVLENDFRVKRLKGILVLSFY